MSIQITSTAFADGGLIPSQYTCDGEDISPPLTWSGIPDETKSLALISDDPDAPGRTWVHWVVYDLPPDSTGLPEGIPATETISGGGTQGKTDFGRIGYGGPCPPSGTHRYFFKLYALDTTLSLLPGTDKAQLESEMDGHILAQTELMGKFSK